MYICLCNAISDHQVRACVKEGACSVAQIYRCHGCRPQCGKCAPLMRALLREHSAGACGPPLESAAGAPSD